ncbi:hypothetical protein BHE74_00041797 [Ensete ventricosum]|nr:hypothetical protein BHE74_00041797 [Ensete ventricosum]
MIQTPTPCAYLSSRSELTGRKQATKLQKRKGLRFRFPVPSANPTNFAFSLTLSDLQKEITHSGPLCRSQGLILELPSDLLTKPTGRPLPRLIAAPTAAAGVYSTPDGTDAEIGSGFSGCRSLPSGPYFLGRPLFFFVGSATGVAAAGPTTTAAAVEAAAVITIAVTPTGQADFSSVTTVAAGEAEGGGGGGWQMPAPSAAAGEGTPPSLPSMHRRARCYPYSNLKLKLPNAEVGRRSFGLRSLGFPSALSTRIYHHKLHDDKNRKKTKEKRESNSQVFSPQLNLLALSSRPEYRRYRHGRPYQKKKKKKNS